MLLTTTCQGIDFINMPMLLKTLLLNTVLLLSKGSLGSLILSSDFIQIEASNDKFEGQVNIRGIHTHTHMYIHINVCVCVCLCVCSCIIFPLLVCPSHGQLSRKDQMLLMKDQIRHMQQKFGWIYVLISMYNICVLSVQTWPYSSEGSTARDLERHYRLDGFIS